MELRRKDPPHFKFLRVVLPLSALGVLFCSQNSFAECERATYEIKKGDTLSEIILRKEREEHLHIKIYGKKGLLRDLIGLNRENIKNPERIFPGQHILIPERLTPNLASVAGCSRDLAGQDGGGGEPSSTPAQTETAPSETSQPEEKAATEVPQTPTSENPTENTPQESSATENKSAENPTSEQQAQASAGEAAPVPPTEAQASQETSPAETAETAVPDKSVEVKSQPLTADVPNTPSVSESTSEEPVAAQAVPENTAPAVDSTVTDSGEAKAPETASAETTSPKPTSTNTAASETSPVASSETYPEASPGTSQETSEEALSPQAEAAPLEKEDNDSEPLMAYSQNVRVNLGLGLMGINNLAVTPAFPQFHLSAHIPLTENLTLLPLVQGYFPQYVFTSTAASLLELQARVALGYQLLEKRLVVGLGARFFTFGYNSLAEAQANSIDLVFLAGYRFEPAQKLELEAVLEARVPMTISGAAADGVSGSFQFGGFGIMAQGRYLLSPHVYVGPYLSFEYLNLSWTQLTGPNSFTATEFGFGAHIGFSF